ncbi:MAG: CapA family protein [Oscillospiraceae bacterium]|nr:CapA family protein [Oscillospiraceae bacterium]
MKIKALLLFLAVLVCLTSTVLAADVPDLPDMLYPYTTVSEKPPELPGSGTEPFTIDLTFVGDCMLATYKGQYYDGSFSSYADTQPPSYFFEKVYSIFSTDDFTIANLENVLTDRSLKETKKTGSTVFWFKAPTRNANILTAGSIEAVSLANNHTDDYGPEGRTDTIAAVKAVGLPYGNEDTTIYLEKNGFRIAVICHGLWNEKQADEIVERIQNASLESDYQIVFYHGGREAVHKPEEWRVRASHKLADAGADLILGNHPHVLQPVEEYNGVHIAYSLGNFCFGGNRKPENRTMIYKMLLTVQDGAVISQVPNMLPCYVFTGSINNWQPALITDKAQRQRVLDFLNWDAPLPY